MCQCNFCNLTSTFSQIICRHQQVEPTELITITLTRPNALIQLNKAHSYRWPLPPWRPTTKRLCLHLRQLQSSLQHESIAILLFNSALNFRRLIVPASTMSNPRNKTSVTPFPHPHLFTPKTDPLPTVTFSQSNYLNYPRSTEQILFRFLQKRNGQGRGRGSEGSMLDTH